MLRKSRTDSASAAIDAMQDAARPALRAPRHCKLRPQDAPFWKTILASKARSEWAPNDLVIAAQLARCQADIEAEQQVLDDEGVVLINARGTQVMNPRVLVLENYARREMALMRALRMAGSSLGTSRDADKQRALERTSRDIRESLRAEDPDGLLAI